MLSQANGTGPPPAADIVAGIYAWAERILNTVCDVRSDLNTTAAANHIGTHTSSHAAEEMQTPADTNVSKNGADLAHENEGHAALQLLAVLDSISLLIVHSLPELLPTGQVTAVYPIHSIR